MEQIRPFPPTDFMDQAEEEEALRLIPAPDLKLWVVANFLTLGGPLHNPDHDHIAEMLHDNEGFLAFAWASSAYKSKQAMVLGQCEKVMFNVGGWRKARQEQQMRDWFGFVPVYLITIDASFCEKANDSEFCALLEHELYHIGHKKNKDSGEFEYTSVGEPRLYLRGHDVEEFHGVVQRYGASEEVQKMVNLANEGPTISRANIAHACGTCLLKLA
ncbi:TPA: putative metallopeptidase [Acinetobacter baumannii]